MPKLSKAEFARVVSEMPGASEEEIFAEASRREAQKQPGIFERLTTPLTDLPSRAAKKVADWVDTPEMDDSKATAMLKGFGAGAIQGAGDLLTSFTSPADIAATVSGVGAAKAGAKGLLGISKAARGLEAASMVPFAAEGARSVGEGIQEGNAGAVGAGALQLAMSLAGASNAAKRGGKVREVVPEQVAPTKPQLPEGELPVSVQMEGAPPEFHAVEPQAAFKQSARGAEVPDPIERIVEKLPGDAPLGSGSNRELALAMQKVEAAKAGQLPREFSAGPPTDKLPSEPGYLYHATNLENAADIAAKSLKPHRPNFGTDQQAWPDRSTSVRSYFTPKAASAWSFAPSEGQPVLLRTKQGKGFKRESTGDVFTTLPVKAANLEIMDAQGNWVPLTKAFPVTK